MSQKPDRPPFWKRKYYINAEFQGSFIQMVIGTALLINLILYGANIYIFYKFNAYGEALSFEQKREFYQFFQTQIVSLNQVFLICGGLVFGILVVYGLLMSHKVAGPLENLKIQFQKIQKLEDLENVHHLQSTCFRKTDYFRDMADEYNKALKQIQQLEWNMKKEGKIEPSISSQEEAEVIPMKKVS